MKRIIVISILFFYMFSCGSEQEEIISLSGTLPTHQVNANEDADIIPIPEGVKAAMTEENLLVELQSISHNRERKYEINDVVRKDDLISFHAILRKGLKKVLVISLGLNKQDPKKKLETDDFKGNLLFVGGKETDIKAGEDIHINLWPVVHVEGSIKQLSANRISQIRFKIPNIEVFRDGTLLSLEKNVDENNKVEFDGVYSLDKTKENILFSVQTSQVRGFSIIGKPFQDLDVNSLFTQFKTEGGSESLNIISGGLLPGIKVKATFTPVLVTSIKSIKKSISSITIPKVVKYAGSKDGKKYFYGTFFINGFNLDTYMFGKELMIKCQPSEAYKKDGVTNDIHVKYYSDFQLDDEIYSIGNATTLRNKYPFFVVYSDSKEIQADLFDSSKNAPDAKFDLGLDDLIDLENFIDLNSCKIPSF